MHFKKTWEKSLSKQQANINLHLHIMLRLTILIWVTEVVLSHGKVLKYLTCHPDTFKMVWNESAFLHVSKDWRDLGTKPSLYHNALEREETGIYRLTERRWEQRTTYRFRFHFDFVLLRATYGDEQCLRFKKIAFLRSEPCCLWDICQLAPRRSLHNNLKSLVHEGEKRNLKHYPYPVCPGKWTDREQNKEQKPRSPTEGAWSDPLLWSPVHYNLAADTDTGSGYLWSS